MSRKFEVCFNDDSTVLVESERLPDLSSQWWIVKILDDSIWKGKTTNINFNNVCMVVEI